MPIIIIIIIGVEKLVLPPILKKRGRPKGAEKTVIGLPSRKKFKGSQIRKPVAFLKKIPNNKDEGRKTITLQNNKLFKLSYSIMVR